jgi:hypothetical protein
MNTVPPTRPTGVLPRSFAAFAAQAPTVLGANRHWRMRAQNFWVEYIEFVAGAAQVASAAEMMVLFPDTPGAVSAPAVGEAAPVQVGTGGVCVLPAGRHAVLVPAGGHCVVLASSRPDIDGSTVLNEAAYTVPDLRISPAGRRYQLRAGVAPVRVYDLAAVAAPADNPRLKMLQTDTLSINWVAYTGERDRSALSPHSHADLEQGSLALAGNYVHHLRVNWGRDANLWRDDEHLAAPSPSLLVVPVELVHTTEGVGAGAHLLVDIFSPPRADFIARGWVHNAQDYLPVPA